MMLNDTTTSELDGRPRHPSKPELPLGMKFPLPKCTPLRDGKHSMYEGGIRVPFTISGPGIKAGAVSHVPVSGIDLLPTMTDLAGRTLEHENLDSCSLRPLLMGRSEEVQRSKGLGESRDLSSKMPEKTDELHRQLVSYLDEVNATTKFMGSKANIYSLWDSTQDEEGK